MSIDTAIVEAVAVALAPVLEELRQLRVEVAAIRAASPPTLVSVARAAELCGVHQATIRRHVRDGSLPARRLGGRVLIDADSLRPTSPEKIAELARSARKARP